MSDNSIGKRDQVPGPSYRPLGAGHFGNTGRKNGVNQEGILVERPPLFTGIPPDEFRRICAAARLKEFNRGEMLYVGGDPVRQILLLMSGSVKVTQTGTSGAEVIIRLGVAGDVLGVLGLVCAGSHRTTAQVFRLCRALVWDVRDFNNLTQRYAILHQNMVRIVSGYLVELEERFREVATERAEPRLARQLVRLQGQIGRPLDGAVDIGLSREELAQMTGMTLFTVSRLLSDWQVRGMVKPRREGLAICDMQSLRALSEEI